MNNKLTLVVEACQHVVQHATSLEAAVDELRRLLYAPVLEEAPQGALVAPRPDPVAEPAPAAAAPSPHLNRGRRGAWVPPAKTEDKLKTKLKPEYTPKLAEAPSAEPVKQVKGMWGKIVELLRANPGREFNAPEVAKKIREDKKQVGVAMAGLRKRGDITKTRHAHYAIGSVEHGNNDEEGVAGVDQQAVNQVRDGVAESAAYQQGKDAFASRAPREKVEDRNPYTDKLPALAGAFAKGWKDAQAAAHE